MATREIKTRFKLEGEQEFKRAMSDAANATKVLDSEMKLAKAQFEQTGDAEAYAAEQARILKEKIEIVCGSDKIWFFQNIVVCKTKINGSNHRKHIKSNKQNCVRQKEKITNLVHSYASA